MGREEEETLRLILCAVNLENFGLQRSLGGNCRDGRTADEICRVPHFGRGEDWGGALVERDAVPC